MGKPKSWKMVRKFFKGDAVLTNIWFCTNNPLLGGLMPVDMLLNGRGKKLEKFIANQLALNEPPKRNNANI